MSLLEIVDPPVAAPRANDARISKPIVAQSCATGTTPVGPNLMIVIRQVTDQTEVAAKRRTGCADIIDP
jgi:hypothetical protein